MGSDCAGCYTSTQDMIGELNISDVMPLSPTETLHAPSSLFFEGDTELLKQGRRVAIVGSRKASDAGVRRARKLASLLAREGVTVVSGLALGVDISAHLGAIGVPGGRTIGVIGTPLSVAYPAKHRETQRLIATDHLLVSQFSEGSRVYPSNFVARNRTMALICDASIIVEAGDGSGTLSQAAETQRLGKPLFFLESALQNENLEWPARFQSAGAVPISSVDDVLKRVA